MKFNHIFRVLIFSAAFVLITSSSAFANTFALSNHSGKTISEIYFRPSGSSSWGNDIIGSHFSNGDSTSVTTYTNTRYWDIYVVFSNGSSGSWGNLDLYTNQKVTITRNGCQTSRA